MKFKFSFAVIISIIFHFSLFALAFYWPQVQKSNGPIYYVDLMQIPGGGGGNRGGSSGSDSLNNPQNTHGQLTGPAGIKDLVVKKEKQEPNSSLYYPDKDKKNKDKSPKQKKEQPSLITVVKKDKNDSKSKPGKTQLITTQRKGTGEVKTGISTGLRFGTGSGSGGSGGPGGSGGSGTGSGGGAGNGTGTGYGDGIGPGSGPGFFPYAYYIEKLKNNISSCWYSSLVSPGLKGKFTAIVYFKILRNGQISELELEKESGNKSLDLSSKRAISEAAPFPPLPSDFPGQYLERNL
ncbi:MAG: TonB C-terminal domain-containing protein [Acidobacteria bacterium]|nr:TonB C-terminal domain-containing protein [Acidobacteriota bacterium]